MVVKKEKILINLRKFPFSYKIFKQAIEQRLASNDFLENPLILEVYKNVPGIPVLEKLIKDICSSKIFDIAELDNVLNAEYKNLDFQADDFYALLWGINYFIKNGGKEIHLCDINKKKIPGKRPDLVMILDGKETYAEVKNVNEQDKLFNVIHNVLEAKSILNSKQYTKVFVIDAKTRLADLDVKDRQLNKIKIEFLEKIDKKISTGKDTFSFKIDNIYFTINVKQSEEFHIYFHKETLGNKTRGINNSSEFFFYGKVYYKTLNKIYNAFLQLLENRRGNFDLVMNDFIYLHYVGIVRRDMHYGDSFVKKLNYLINVLDIDKIVKVVTNLS